MAELADDDGEVSLLEVVRAAAPHALVGVTGQPGLFTEAVIRAQAALVRHPIVLPMSNPTPRRRVHPRRRADLDRWEALWSVPAARSGAVTIGTRSHPITQVNNLYLFPGLGRGVIAVGAARVSDAMLSVAATAIGSVRAAGRHSSGNVAAPT